MNITDTKMNKENALIPLSKDIYCKSMPFSKFKEYLDGIVETATRKDETDDQADRRSLDAMNSFFRDLIVDKNGDSFEDLIEADVIDVLDIKTIHAIIAALSTHLVPSVKE